jgi:short-subunit dehydrogenase
MQGVVIVGASSGIGAALAVELAAHGRTIVLVARRQAELEAVAARVSSKGARAVVVAADVRDADAAAPAWQQIVASAGTIDTVVYAAGVMPEVGPDEFDTLKDRQMIEVNFLGAVAWLNAAASHLQRQGHGTLCGIGSVAGDRGRRGAPVYGATKAALHSYLESLRNRLEVKGIHVVTVKPGPVRTAMVGDRQMPLMVEPEVAARAIAAGLHRGAHTVYVHGGWRLIMWVIRNIPSVLFRRLSV